MPFSCFNDFPDEAPLWIYAFPESLNEQRLQIVNQALVEFCAGWHSHGAKVDGRFVIYKSRFVLISGTEDNGISGCSTDSSVHVFKALQRDHQLDAFDIMLIHYQGENQVHSVTREDFAERCASGDIQLDTTVYNCNLNHLHELRAGMFETTVANSWHAEAFSLVAS